jgi:CheY-like chemotaxis protein
LGLGLAISQKLVHLMGGELSVISTLGKGSTFAFELDLPQVTNIKEPLKTDKRTIIGFSGSKRRILIADDKEENREVLKAMLLPLGFKMTEASGGREAKDKLAEFQPDIILLDLVMPEIDGFEFIRQLHQMPLFKEIPVIAISASVFQRTQQDILAIGCNDFLSKPIQLEKLLELLQTYLKIEWIYAEPVETELQDDVQEILPLLVPPPEELAALMKLVKIRNITGIREFVKQKQAQNAQWIPFVSKVEQLSKKYQFKPLINFIEKHLDEK